MKTEIIAILRNHKGKSNAITVARIASRIPAVKLRMTNPEVRTAIRELISKQHIPIAGCSKGYYWIETEGERLQCIDNLTNRILGIQRRIGSLRSCTI